MSNFDQRLQAGWRVWSEESPADFDSSESMDPRWMRELDQIAGTGPIKTRSVPIRLLAPMLVDAYQQNSAWLEDFEGDMVVLDADLHEVLLAYQKLQQETNDRPAFDQARRAAA